MLEKSLEARCRLLVIKNGGLLIKILPSAMAGLPDRLCILPNRPMFFIELKKPGGKEPSELQKAVHRMLKKLGQITYVVYDFETMQQILQHHLNLPTYDFRTTGKEPFY